MEAAGTKIREARTAQGMSRTALARAVGTSRTTIIHVEEWSHEPGFSTVVRIARVLGLSLESLCSETTPA